MVDFLDEIQEDIRHERLARLWSRYGSWVIYVSLAITLGVVAVTLYYQHREESSLQASKAYHTAITAAEKEADAPADAATIDSLANLEAPYSDGYYFLSRLQAARLQLNRPDSRQAGLAALQALAGDDRLQAHPALRDLIRLEWAAAAMQQAETAGNEENADIAQTLDALSASGGSYAGTAREMRAALAIEQEEKATAIALFRQLRDDASSLPGQRQRAEAFLHVLTAPVSTATPDS